MFVRIQQTQLQSVNMLLPLIYGGLPMVEGPSRVHVRCVDAQAVSNDAVIGHGLQHHGFAIVMRHPL